MDFPTDGRKFRVWIFYNIKRKRDCFIYFLYILCYSFEREIKTESFGDFLVLVGKKRKFEFPEQFCRWRNWCLCLPVPGEICSGITWDVVKLLGMFCFWILIQKISFNFSLFFFKKSDFKILFLILMYRCIPWRYKKKGKSAGVGDIEFLLISSQKSPKWMFPKVPFFFLFFDRQVKICNFIFQFGGWVLWFSSNIFLNCIIRVVGNLMKVWRRQPIEKPLKKLGFLVNLG